jgi:hypothetical protein
MKALDVQALNQSSKQRKMEDQTTNEASAYSKVCTDDQRK